jgi:predicted secreted Zn-dependent protease
MRMINNYNLLRKIIYRTKFLVNVNLSKSNKVRRELRKEMKAVTTKKILKNTRVDHSQVRLRRYL